MTLSFPRLSRNQYLFTVAVLLAFVAYFGGLKELVFRWYKQDEYSHGFFIPLISLWILWQRREQLAASTGAPSFWGVIAIIVAVAMLLLGELTAIFLLIQLAFLLVLVGLVLCYGGSSLLKLCILPIALLLFCIPMPYFVDSQLSWRLQLLSSNLGVGFLRLMNYSVFLEGNVIDLGVYKLQVVEACSGLRYLYPLLSLGFLMAYMYPAALGWRALVFLSTVPITVLTNSFRIAMVGVLVERWGSGMADGFLHYFEGWIIFIVCQLLLMGEIWLIERFGQRRSVIEVQQFPEVDAVPPRKPALLKTNPALLAGLAALILAIGTAQILGGRVEEKPARMSLKTFPLALGNWRATENSLAVDVEQALGFDDYVLADYQNDSGRMVNFYVAYYGSQRKGVSPHSPQVCIPGGGWVISSLSRVPLTLVDGQPMEAVRVVIDKGGQKQLVYYWFEQRGRRIANEYWMKWYLLLDSIVRNRTDGALVRVTTPVGAMETAEAADERVQAFVRLAVPQLGSFVPN